LQLNILDMWFWHLHTSKKYNVTSAYYYMMSSVNIVAADHSNTIWNNEVPLKVNLFAWRLLRNRLPTTDNLIRRHILHHNAQLCVGGCGIMEDINHLFLSCDFFGKIWIGISNWLGFTTVHPKHVADHFLQFENLGGFPKNIRITFQLIWLAFIWVIWCERNAQIFRNQEESLQQLLDKIKLQSWQNYYLWWLNPLACLGITLQWGFSVLFIPTFCILM